MACEPHAVDNVLEILEELCRIIDSTPASAASSNAPTPQKTALDPPEAPIDGMQIPSEHALEGILQEALANASIRDSLSPPSEVSAQSRSVGCAAGGGAEGLAPRDLQLPTEQEQEQGHEDVADAAVRELLSQLANLRAQHLVSETGSLDPDTESPSSDRPLSTSEDERPGGGGLTAHGPERERLLHTVLDRVRAAAGPQAAAPSAARCRARVGYDGRAPAGQRQSLQGTSRKTKAKPKGRTVGGPGPNRDAVRTGARAGPDFRREFPGLDVDPHVRRALWHTHQKVSGGAGGQWRQTPRNGSGPVPPTAAHAYIRDMLSLCAALVCHGA